jgi:hypothetical protein
MGKRHQIEDVFMRRRNSGCIAWRLALIIMAADDLLFL